MTHRIGNQLLSFHQFLGYRLFTMLASEMVQAAIPLLIYQKTGSITWSGLTYTITWLPRVLFQPMMGALVDAMPARMPFWLTDFARAAVTLFLFFLGDPIFLALGGAIFGLFTGMAFIAVERAVSLSLGMKRSPDIQSKLQFAEQTAIIFGPLLATTLVSASAGRFVFVTASIVFSVGIFVTRWIFSIKNEGVGMLKLGSLFDRIYAGIREILAKPSLLRLACTTAAINFVEGICVAALPARIVGSLHHSDNSIGLILSASAAQNLLLLLLISKYFGSIDTRAVFKFGLILVPLGALLFGLTTNIWLSGLGYILLITGRVLFVLHMRIERAKLIEPESFSATMGAFLSIILLPLPLAGIALSVFGVMLGVEQLITYLAFLFALVAIPVLLLQKEAE